MNGKTASGKAPENAVKMGPAFSHVLTRIVVMFPSAVDIEKLLSRGQNPDRLAVGYLGHFNNGYKSKAKVPLTVTAVYWPIS